MRILSAWSEGGIILSEAWVISGDHCFEDCSEDEDNYSLSFDGVDDYVSIENTSISLFGSDWNTEKSITAWIKPEGTVSTIQGGWHGHAVYGQFSGNGTFLEFHLVLLIVKIESGYITGMATMIG